MSTDLVPFGKHKGQSVETLMADPGYREWLMAQPWFRERYPSIYQVIVNYNAEPADTPEHNAMQAGFLDDERCKQLVRIGRPDALNHAAARRLLSRNTYAPTLASHLKAELEGGVVRSRSFEERGWDVSFHFEPTALYLAPISLPSCICVCDHERDCPGAAACRGGESEYECRHTQCAKRVTPTFEQWQRIAKQRVDDADLFRTLGGTYFRNYGVTDARFPGHHRDCIWDNSRAMTWLMCMDDGARWFQPSAFGVRVECKPDLGDDYPSVLRQVTRYERERHDLVFVVVRRHAFESVTWEQVESIFNTQKVRLIRESALDTKAEATA